MQVIPRMDSHLFVRLDSAFERFMYEHDDDFVYFVRLHLGLPYAKFLKHIPCDDGSLLLDYSVGYDYVQEISDIKRNLTISNYSQKRILDNRLSADYNN